MHVRNRPDKGRLGRGLLTSIFLHVQILLAIFLLAHFYGQKTDDEVELSFESAKESELPADLPPVDQPAEPESRQPDQPSPTKEPPKVARTENKPEPEIEIPPPEKLPPIPKPPEPPLVQTPPPKPDEPVQPPPEKLHQKIVELDMGKEVEAPDNAKYLAEKNNRAEEETRARETNLEREQKGGEAQPSDQEDKIAGLEDREARPEKRTFSPRAVPESFKPETPNRVTLSMRSPGTRDAEKMDESPDGLNARAEAMRGHDHDDDFARGGRLRLTRRQYEAAFGTDAEAAEALARSQRSKRKGKFAARQALVRSALENFIPEVKPGNQTALNTRAAPFAQFITRMHRKIHELWAFGFLNDLDGKPSHLPLNDPNLVAKLEIVLDPQGHVDRVNMVRSSGLTVYDAAAIDVVYSAAPYPPPPPTILSGNGKVYIHWTFHRNEMACDTMGVDYFILNNGPKVKERATPPS